MIGVRPHDLVHDLCLQMAGGREKVRIWYARLVNAYRELKQLRSTGDQGSDEAGQSSGIERDE